MEGKKKERTRRKKEEGRKEGRKGRKFDSNNAKFKLAILQRKKRFKKKVEGGSAMTCN